MFQAYRACQIQFKIETCSGLIKESPPRFAYGVLWRGLISKRDINSILAHVFFDFKFYKYSIRIIQKESIRKNFTNCALFENRLFHHSLFTRLLFLFPGPHLTAHKKPFKPSTSSYLAPASSNSSALNPKSEIKFIALSSTFFALQALTTSAKASTRFRFAIWLFLPECNILLFDLPIFVPMLVHKCTLLMSEM